MRVIPIILTAAAWLSFSGDGRRYVPPGTVRITERFFADETEVSNRAWQEYESWTAARYGKGSHEHLATLPDTLVWRDPKAYNEPYVTYYYRHAAYRNYPVVGVSHSQAAAFCKWRTERVKEQYARKQRQSIDLTYRLPTEEEWEFLVPNASVSMAVPDENGKPLFNCYFDDSTAYAGSADVTAPVISHGKNGFGLYNMIGNVAEMVAEPGVCKGGSWRQRAEDCRPGKRIRYEKAQSWVGFRCVCDYTVKTR